MTPRDQLARDVLLAIAPHAASGSAASDLVRIAFGVADLFLAEAARTTESAPTGPRAIATEDGVRLVRSAKAEEPKRYAAPDVWHAFDVNGWRPWSPSQRAAWSGGPEYDGSVRVCFIGGAAVRDGAPEDFDWSQVASWRPL